jgi:hypothetical protein
MPAGDPKRAERCPRDFVVGGGFGRWDGKGLEPLPGHRRHLRVAWTVPAGGTPEELAAAVLQHVAFLVLDRWRLGRGCSFKAVVGMDGTETDFGPGSTRYSAWLNLRNGATSLTAEGFVGVFRLLPAGLVDGDPVAGEPGLTVRVRETTDKAFGDAGIGVHTALRVPVVRPRKV